MPKALEGLTIGEVSVVDHPAHLEEGWMVLKAAGATPEQIKAVETVEALVDAIAKAVSLNPAQLAEIGSDVLNDSHRAVLKALGSTNPQAKEATDMPFDKSTLDAEALAYVESLEATAADAVAKAAASDPDPEATALAKAMEGLPEPLRKHLATQQAELAKARETAETERNKRLDAEYLAKAREFEHLSIKPEELAPTLRKAADLDPTLFVEIDTVLKAANAQAESADIFKAIGEGAASIPTGSAHAQLDAFAKAAVESGDAADYPTALAKAATDHPELYAEYRHESLTQEV